jgi:hypothetical protein
MCFLTPVLGGLYLWSRIAIWALDYHAGAMAWRLLELFEILNSCRYTFVELLSIEAPWRGGSLNYSKY